MKSIRLTVANEHGLHARPLAVFVRTAGAFKTTAITVRNVTKNGQPRNARSIALAITAFVDQGNEIEISADGPEEDAALDAIRVAVESGLGEALG